MDGVFGNLYVVCLNVSTLERLHVRMLERLNVNTFQLQVRKFAGCKLNNKLQRSVITMNYAVGQITYEV